MGGKDDKLQLITGVFSLKNPINKDISSSSPHFLPHFLKRKKYSTGIYKAFKGGWSNLSATKKKKALSKQWYVRWSYRNPKTGKLERQKNLYGTVNSLKTYKERILLLRHIEDNLIALLNSGYNPYTDNLESENVQASVFDAFDKAMEIKRLHMKPSSFTRFKSDINKFKKYLSANGYERRFITSVTRATVNGYLNETLHNVTPRSRNNYKTSIGTLFQTLENEGLIEKNFVKTIPMLRSIPKTHKIYTEKQVKELLSYMETNTPELALFIKFVSYNFLRPIEVCRLRVKDLDLENGKLSVFVKQGRVKTKIIPEILRREFAYNVPLLPEKLIFGKGELFTEWPAKVERRRAYYTSRFREVKKFFGLSDEYTLYGFRHYHITKLYRSMRNEGLTPFETKSKLMLITGHETMSALEKYLRSIDAELPEDYSFRI